MQPKYFVNLFITGLFVLGAGCASAGDAQAKGPQPHATFLGKRTVNFGADRDVIQVGRVDGKFNALRIHNTGKSPMEMWDIKVHFGNGKVWSPGTRLVFKKNSWTRRIELPGKNPRTIKKVVFYYKSKAKKNGKAKIELFGLH